MGIGLAVLLILGGGWTLVQQHQMIHNAAVTEGTIVTSSLGSERVSTRPVVFDATGTIPQITYKYTIDGTTYKSDSLRLIGSRLYAMDPKQAAVFARTHQEGTTVSIYYRPGSPEQSFLVRQYAFIPSYIALIGGLLLIGDCITSGSTLGWLLRLSANDTRPRSGSRLRSRYSETNDESTSNSGAVSEKRDPLLSRDLLVWIGVIATSEALVVHYYLISNGPDTVAAPLLAIGLLVLLGV